MYQTRIIRILLQPVSTSICISKYFILHRQFLGILYPTVWVDWQCNAVTKHGSVRVRWIPATPLLTARPWVSHLTILCNQHEFSSWWVIETTPGELSHKEILFSANKEIMGHNFRSHDSQARVNGFLYKGRHRLHVHLKATLYVIQTRLALFLGQRF